MGDRAGSSPVIRSKRTLKIGVLFILCCISCWVNWKKEKLEFVIKLQGPQKFLMQEGNT